MSAPLEPTRFSSRLVNMPGHARPVRMACLRVWAMCVCGVRATSVSIHTASQASRSQATHTTNTAFPLSESFDSAHVRAYAESSCSLSPPSRAAVDLALALAERPHIGRPVDTATAPSISDVLRSHALVKPFSKSRVAMLCMTCRPGSHRRHLSGNRNSMLLARASSSTAAAPVRPANIHAGSMTRIELDRM
jgi:hypothetical protein